MGVTFDGDALGLAFRLGVMLSYENVELAEELAGMRLASDSMGLGSIIYWPSVTAPNLGVARA